MVSLSSATISLGELTTPIARFEVWFATPFGLVRDREQAVNIVLERDLDPELTLKAVPMAIGEAENVMEAL